MISHHQAQLKEYKDREGGWGTLYKGIWILKFQPDVHL